MEYTFFFESKFRGWGSSVNYLKFHTFDDTEFLISEEWIVSNQRNKRIPLQRLIFLKRNNYFNAYRVIVKVSSTSSQTSGEIVLKRNTKALRTSIIILLSDFQKLHYPVEEKIILEGVEICHRIPDDTFKYKVTVKRLGETQRENEILRERDEILTMSDQLRVLFESGDFSDIVVTDEDRSFEIPAHRNILAARSDYFKGMFMNDWRENREGTAKIEKDKSEVFAEILYFLYTGVIRPMKFSLMVDLYVVSHEFLLDELKNMLFGTLQKSLNVENAVDIYLETYHTREGGLKSSSLEFIRDNFDEIKNTHAWKCLETEGRGSEALRSINTFLTEQNIN